MLYPTAEHSKRQPAWSQLATAPVNQPLRGRKAVPGENEMEMILAQGLGRHKHQACLLSAMLFTALGSKVSQGNCKWR